MIMTGTAFTDDLHMVEGGRCSVVRLMGDYSNDASGSRLLAILWGRRYSGGDADYPLL